MHSLISNISHFHSFSNNVSSCSQFVEACFGPFSAQLAKVGSYRALEKEAQDLIGALHEKLERRRRDLQTGLGVAVRSKIKLTTLELKVCYISVGLICTYLLVIISANSCVEKNVLLLFLSVVVVIIIIIIEFLTSQLRLGNIHLSWDVVIIIIIIIIIIHCYVFLTFK